MRSIVIQAGRKNRRWGFLEDSFKTGGRKRSLERMHDKAECSFGTTGVSHERQKSLRLFNW